MSGIIKTFDYYLDLFVTSLSSIMTGYKKRKWANKEKGLMIWEMSMIVISVVIATLVVSQLDEPEHRVGITPTLISFDFLLNLLPNSFSFVIDIFNFVGKIFINLQRFMFTISFKLRYFLGPIWDIIIYIPLKIFQFIHFILICLASILTYICNLFANFFNKLSFYISAPFKLLFNLFKAIGLYLKKLFDFIFGLPVISHFIHFINLLIQDIIILFTSFLVCLTKLFTFITGFFEWLDLDKIWAYLTNFKLFNFIISIPKFFFNFFINIFKYIFQGISFVLQKLHLYNIFASFFGNLYNWVLRFSLFIVNIIVHLFIYLHDILLYIPLACNWLILHLNKMHIKLIPLDFMRGFFTFILDTIKWIFLFPVFMIRRFYVFVYYLLTSFSFDGLRSWWDNLCKDQPGGCGQSMTKLTDEVVNLRITVEKLMTELNNQTK